MIDAHYADDGEFEFDETCQEEYGKCQHTKLEEDNVKKLFKIQFYWEVTILRLPPTGLFKSQLGQKKRQLKPSYRTQAPNIGIKYTQLRIFKKHTQP